MVAQTVPKNCQPCLSLGFVQHENPPERWKSEFFKRINHPILPLPSEKLMILISCNRPKN